MEFNILTLIRHSKTNKVLYVKDAIKWQFGDEENIIKYNKIGKRY